MGLQYVDTGKWGLVGGPFDALRRLRRGASTSRSTGDTAARQLGDPHGANRAMAKSATWYVCPALASALLPLFACLQLLADELSAPSLMHI